MKRTNCLLVLFLLLLCFEGSKLNAMENELMMSKEPVLQIETNQGVIEVALKPQVAPKACENFLRLAQEGYYDGVVFHRVIKGFMVQGGDPTATGAGGNSIWGEPFEDEVDVDETFSKRGVLAMANAGPHTNGSQFFITTAETPWLNGRHTIFGEVVSGYDVVQKIESSSTDGRDKPREPQKILSMSLKGSELVSQMQ